MALIYLKQSPKLHHSSKNFRVWKKYSAITNLKTLKTLQTFMPTCKWKETEHNLEQQIIKAASSDVYTLLDNLEAYFPSLSGIRSKIKDVDFKPFW